MHKTEKKTPQTLQFLKQQRSSVRTGVEQVKKKKSYYSKYFICEGVFCIAKEEQCLKLQDYIIQKTIAISSSVCLLSTVTGTTVISENSVSLRLKYAS